MDKFEYRVCQVQQSRVTFANGQWAGRLPRSSVTINTGGFDSLGGMLFYIEDNILEVRVGLPGRPWPFAG